ncbi:hypothetical protein DFH07DRAFT_892361 [Mycena maculata]|uniref:Knr4/Smi1-like domain-containing protein n=1 Tax=Mycena maculata TaxID=230809 RepID=A0AAD7IDX5_9AGAR|nr:hypothetical protein DFH07DRAFT_892361 [Mycena maculata]
MGWFTNLFSPAAPQDSRRGQALNSTHDAFSLRTSSPTFGAHPDAFNPDTLNADLESAGAGPSYTYPPQNSPRGSPVYGYVPTTASSRHSSLLPTHHDSVLTPHYPPLSVTWTRLRAWLSREYPELGDTLNYGILPQDLAQLETQLGFDLPAAVRESYLVADGQEAESAAGCSDGLFFGLTLLPLEDVLEEWQFWREVDDDPSTGANVQLRDTMRSIPTGWVRKEYSQRGWIPLIADKAGNYVGVDLSPDDGGSVGQVIVFGRDFDTKVVLWTGDGPAGWAKWLSCFVDELESGEGYEIGGADNSEEDEDNLGYENYFSDGSGRQGDGGGDNGAGGGMRLAGEYRGWNVLEAWADRSIRKWYEMGLITEPLGPPEENAKEEKPNAGLGVLLPSDAEVPIPVVNVSSEDPTTPITTRGALPTISVTKPPAPLPVDLPTQNDIDTLPSPNDSPTDSRRSSFHDDDLESGHAHGMREISQEPPLASRRAPSSAPHQNAQASGSASPPSTASLTTSVPVPIIPDLLADSAPPMDAAPITPSPLNAPAAAILTPEPVAAPPPASESAPAEPEEDAVDPDVTIRLVGGGGVAGVSAEDVAPAADVDALVDGVQTDGEVDTDVESVSSQTAPTDGTQKVKKPKHKKTLSGLAGLKKLGGLGLRKKDSNASVKDAAAAAVAVPAT